MPLRAPPGLGLAVIAAVIIAAAVGVLAAAGDDDGREIAASTSSTSSTSTSGGATETTRSADLPAAPWRGGVPRSAVPAAYATAWDQARNKATCALLFPLDGGPQLQGAQATADPTPGNNGWDIFLTSGAASIEVLGLFDKASQAQRTPGAATYTRSWADGSVAKYSADVGGAAPGTYDPNTSPFEAVLTLPDQACTYRVYDTLGKDHIEFMFDRLRLMAP